MVLWWSMGDVGAAEGDVRVCVGGGHVMVVMWWWWCGRWVAWRAVVRVRMCWWWLCDGVAVVDGWCGCRRR
jgi:hypothetical protein